jgi:uncharacterized protein (TIGR02453 family)
LIVARAPEVGRFTGFPPEAVAFFRDLAADNTKRFWDEHRATYDTAVKGPMLALTAELTDEFGTFHLFRPHRDVRFSKDKSPYKTHQGAVTEGEGAEAFYLHLAPDGLWVGSGYHHMARDQLARFRAAVADDDTGPELEAVVAELERRYEIGGAALATAPRGYPRDHPRIGLLRHKGLTVGREFGTPPWLSNRRVVTQVAQTWRGAAAMNAWLARNVGPSEEPPDERH